MKKTVSLEEMGGKTMTQEKRDVGKGYYCEFLEQGLPCVAINRKSCVGCKTGRRRRFKLPQPRKKDSRYEIDLRRSNARAFARMQNEVDNQR